MDDLFKRYQIDIDIYKFTKKINSKECANSTIPFTIHDFNKDLIQYNNENYDKDFNLTINSNPQYNNKILDGKIVFFNYNLEYILDKINYIDGVNNFSNSKNKFTVDGIYVNTYTCGVYKAYIIY